MDNSNIIGYTLIMKKKDKEKSSSSVPIYTTSNGGRFIKPSDLLKDSKVKEILREMDSLIPNTPPGQEESEEVDKNK